MRHNAANRGKLCEAEFVLSGWPCYACLSFNFAITNIESPFSNSSYMNVDKILNDLDNIFSKYSLL